MIYNIQFITGPVRKCISGFSELDLSVEGDEFWILGDLFISKFYTIFDQENRRVGLANSSIY